MYYVSEEEEQWIVVNCHCYVPRVGYRASKHFSCLLSYCLLFWMFTVT